MDLQSILSEETRTQEAQGKHTALFKGEVGSQRAAVDSKPSPKWEACAVRGLYV